MENIDVLATLELLAGILIVLGIAVTFFKKTKATPTETVEEAPYKVETPAPVASVEVDQTAVVVAAEVNIVETPAKKTRKPRAPKAEIAKVTKAPATKKPRAKKV
jgi:hypothetical protein